MRFTNLLVAAAVFVPGAAGAADPQWIEVRSPNFTVVGTAKEKDAKAIAQHFESMRIVFQASMPGAFADPAQPVIVYAMRDSAGLDSLFGKKVSQRMAGAFMNVGHSLHVPMRLDFGPVREEIAQLVAAHEYHHLFLDRLGAPVPLWLREGLANLWGGTHIKGNTVEIGAPRDFGRYVSHAKNVPLLPIEELIAVDGRSKHYNESGRVGIFYAEATVLTHMLILGEPDGEAKLRRFVALLEAGRPQIDALRETFGEPKKIEDRLHAYLRKPNYNYVRSTLKGTISQSQLEVRKLSPAEALVLQAAFLAHVNREAAEPVADRALAAAPTDPRALQVKGLLTLWKGERSTAAALFARAAEAEGAGFFPHYLAAVTATNAAPSFVERHLAASVEANPRYAPAMFRLAAARATSDPEGATRLAIDAARLDPGQPAHLLRAARVLRLAGRKNDGAQLATQSMIRALARNDANVSNSVCWSGSIGGFASVVFAACENAVMLDPDGWAVRDTRGLARALVGDKKGAVEDFRYALDKVEIADPTARLRFLTTREAWIAALENGVNPFDAKTLDALEEAASWDL